MTHPNGAPVWITVLPANNTSTSLTSFVSHMADVAPSTPMVSRRLH